MSETEFRFRSEEDASAAETGVELPSEDIPAPEDIPATETEVSFRLDDPPVAQAGPSAVLGPKKELARLATRRMRSHANSAGPAMPNSAITELGTTQPRSPSRAFRRYRIFLEHRTFLRNTRPLRHKRFLKHQTFPLLGSSVKNRTAGKMPWWIMDHQ